MKINISDGRKIFSIQNEFSDLFPYLKLEFFTRPHRANEPSSKKTINHPGKTLGECRTVHTKGSIAIIPSMTVTDLEQNFRNIYGLSVQVFRKSGKVWLETTVTDSWTLEEQNRQGEALSNTERSKVN